MMPINLIMSEIPFKRRQTGSALLISLIMLLLLSLIAVAGMQSTILQGRMSTNLQDRNLAFQAAEAALREGERYVRVNPTLQFSNQNGLYMVNNSGMPDWRVDVNDGDANDYRVSDAELPRVAQKPRYYIEEIDTIRTAGSSTEAGNPVPPTVFYRVTALGFGGSSDTTVVLSSVYQNQ